MAITLEGIRSSIIFLRGNIVAEPAQVGREDAGVLDVAKLVNDLEAVPERPPGDAAAPMAAAVPIAAKKGQTVCLTGRGGDERYVLSRQMEVEAAAGEPTPHVPMPDTELDAPADVRPPLMKFVALHGEIVAYNRGSTTCRLWPVNKWSVWSPREGARPERPKGRPGVFK